MTRFVLVRWRDSCMQHAQVDSGDLPTPSTLETVGWLSFNGPDHIVVSRDHSPDPGSYSWRSSVAIPRPHLIEMRDLTQMVAAVVIAADSESREETP